jgi:hypothetical protein
MRSGFVWILLLLLSHSIWSQVATGAIAGTVKDSADAVIPGAKIVVLNEGTGATRALTTDEAGRYSAPGLIVGGYRVTASKDGFKTEVRTGIGLTVAREAVVDFALALGSVTQEVVVPGEAPLVESTTASLGSLVDDRTIRAVPLNGRSWDQLALQQPGVATIDAGPLAGTPFVGGSGKRFSVGGQISESVSFLLDGTDINDQANGIPGGSAGTNLGVDTILEFKIFTNAFEAAYGHSSGAVVSAVTRSGTNRFRGTAFEYIRNSALDAKNYFDVGSSPPPFHRNQFGGVFGGPIKKDKTFFFTGYEGLQQGLATTLTAVVPTAQGRLGNLPTGTVTVNPAVVPYLALYPLPNRQDFGNGTGTYVTAPLSPTTDNNVMVRIDHQLTKSNNLFGRYTFDQDSVTAPQSIPNETAVSHSRRQYATVQMNSILGPKMLNNARFAFNSTNSYYNVNVPNELGFVPGQPLGGLTVGGITGNANSRPVTPLGAANGLGPSLFDYNILEWADDFTYLIGRHSFKTGLDVQRVMDNTSFNQQQTGLYTFSTFNAFLAGTPASFGVGLPLGANAEWDIRQTLFGVYVQDDYKVNERLTLNLGLRWEAPTNPSDANGKTSVLPSNSATAMVPTNYFFQVGKTNLEPRFGLAWQVDGTGKTVVRLGAGIYHNQLLPWSFYHQTRGLPFFGLGRVTNPTFPNAYQLFTGPLSATGTGLTSINNMAAFNKTPTDYQYNLSLQHELWKNTLFQLAYAGNRGIHIINVEEGDTPIPTICSSSLSNCPAGIPNGTTYYPVGATRRNPSWNGEKIIAARGNSMYNSGTVTLRHQSVKGFVGQVFYTFSKAMDLGDSVDGSYESRSPSGIMDPENPNLDWGLADFNATNQFGGNFVYPLPFHAGSKGLQLLVGGWTFDGTATLTSGLPFTPVLAAAVSRNLSSQLSERPNLNPGFSPSPTHGISAGCSGFAAGTPVRTAAHWYDPCAFSIPTAGTYGNLKRNTIIGPGLENMDLALEKNFNVRDRANIGFRTEMFNVLNHTNLGLPTTAPLTSTGAANPNAGSTTYTTTTSRQLQFGVRINF